MAGSRSGYLLMETLIALFILAVVTVPWLGFLRTHHAQTTLARVDRFFLTKRVFLEALDNPSLEGSFHDQRGQIVIRRSLRSDGLRQLEVNLVEKGRPLISLVGVTR